MTRSKRFEKRTSQRYKADFAETLIPDSVIRKTGIRVMGDMPWGAHICLFYETKQDLLDTNVSYLKAGLENHEFCVWAISAPITDEEAKNSLREGIPDFDQHLAAGSINLLPGYEWYLKGNEFDVQRITGGWNDKLREAMSKGYEGLRKEALAEDLERWRAGEPIEARPVGRLEKGLKWVRRNPVVAGMLAVIGLSVLSLVGSGAYFMTTLAEQNATLAGEVDRAERAERDATAQAAKAEAARGQAEKDKEAAQSSSAHHPA